MTTTADPIHLDLRTAAKRGGVSLETLRQEIEKGNLVRVYIGAKPVIRIKDLEAWSERLPTERRA